MAIGHPGFELNERERYFKFGVITYQLDDATQLQLGMTFQHEHAWRSR